MTSRTGALAAGLAGGLVGGVAFGLLMQMMGMMPMVAMLARSESVFVGWIVHLLISSAIGVSFALLFNSWARTLAVATAIGVGYGALWWVIGGLAAMPSILGMPMFNVNAMAWQSLMGHLVYGALLGATFGFIRR
ncbi:MAG: hypothetical protein ACRDF9_15075 [Candidatus Limnocylindria bacterium]